MINDITIILIILIILLLSRSSSCLVSLGLEPVFVLTGRSGQTLRTIPYHAHPCAHMQINPKHYPDRPAIGQNWLSDLIPSQDDHPAMSRYRHFHRFIANKGEVMAKALKRISANGFLIWVYQKHLADKIVDQGHGLLPAEKAAAGIEHYAVSGDGTFQIERNAAVGTVIDYSGPAGSKLPHDAELAHDLIRSNRFSRLERGILIEYGRSGLEPDWVKPTKQHLRPHTSKRGIYKMVHTNPRKPAQVLANQEYIAHRREIYTKWYDALMRLVDVAAENRDMFTEYLVEKPSVAREPWL